MNAVKITEMDIIARTMDEAEKLDRYQLAIKLFNLDVDNAPPDEIVTWLAVARIKIGRDTPCRAHVLKKLRARLERQGEQDIDAIIECVAEV